MKVKDIKTFNIKPGEEWQKESFSGLWRNKKDNIKYSPSINVEEEYNSDYGYRKKDTFYILKYLDNNQYSEPKYYLPVHWDDYVNKTNEIKAYDIVFEGNENECWDYWKKVTNHKTFLDMETEYLTQPEKDIYKKAVVDTIRNILRNNTSIEESHHFGGDWFSHNDLRFDRFMNFTKSLGIGKEIEEP